MLSLFQVVSLLGAMIGLVDLLFDPYWTTSRIKRHLTSLRLAALLAVVFLSCWCSATGSFPTQGRIVVGSIAVVPLALISIWAVACRDSPALRMATFLLLLAALAILLSKPITLQSSSVDVLGLTLHSLDRLRLSLGICAGTIAGVYCRILGWRIQVWDPGNKRPDARTHDLWVLIIGIALTVPLLLLIQYAASQFFSSLYDPNFAMIRMSCFYSACMLAYLSIMVCRFSNQWLVAAFAIICVLAIQFAFGEGLYHRLGFLDRPSSYSWYQLTSLFILVWWALCFVLRQLDVVFQKTGELLLFQFQIKHFVVGTAVACFLVANVNSQYRNEFPKALRRDLQAVGGDAELQGNRVVSIRIDRGGIPDIVWKCIPQLRDLRLVSINSTTIDQELVELLLRCPNLTSLRLTRCESKSTVDFSGFEHLESIFLHGVGMSRQQLIELTSDSSITHLAMDDAAATVIPSLPTKSLRTLELLDLHGTFATDRLLKIQAPELQTISFLRPGKGFTAVPNNLPKLRELKLECTKLTPSTVAEINELKYLTQLDLYGMKSGVQYIKNLKVEDVGVTGSHTTTQFRLLVDEPKVRRVYGSVPLSALRSMVSRIIAANEERALSVELLAAVPRDNYPTNARVPGLLQQLRMQPGGLSQVERRLQISDYGAVFHGVPLQLGDLSKLLQVTSNISIQAPIYDGETPILSDFHSGASRLEYAWSRSMTRIFNLTDETWNKLSLMLPSGDVLLLVNPDISKQTWRSIATRSEVELHVAWPELPRNYENAVTILANRIATFFVKQKLSKLDRSAFYRDSHRLRNFLPPEANWPY